MKKLKIIILATLLILSSIAQARSMVRVTFRLPGYTKHLYFFVDETCEQFMAESCHPEAWDCIDNMRIINNGGGVANYNTTLNTLKIQTKEESLQVVSDELETKINQLIKKAKKNKVKIKQTDIDKLLKLDNGFVSAKRANTIAKELNIKIVKVEK